MADPTEGSGASLETVTLTEPAEATTGDLVEAAAESIVSEAIETERASGLDLEADDVEDVAGLEDAAEPQVSEPDVVDAVADAAGRVAPSGAGEPAAGHMTGSCPVAWCPVCLAVTAVQPLSPQVVEHLLKAGTELLLAFRGVLDTRADSLTGRSSERPADTTLEKIDLG